MYETVLRECQAWRDSATECSSRVIELEQRLTQTATLTG
jgi:hypothetical protein